MHICRIGCHQPICAVTCVYNRAKYAIEKEATINQNDVANNPIHEIATMTVL